MVDGKGQKVGSLAVQCIVFSEFFLVTRFLNHADYSLSDLEKDSVKGREPSTLTCQLLHRYSSLFSSLDH